jgi:hypothetical protein
LQSTHRCSLKNKSTTRAVQHAVHVKKKRGTNQDTKPFSLLTDDGLAPVNAELNDEHILKAADASTSKVRN